MGPKRFRIAFSFAGEKRDFIGKVAAILAQRFGESAILYDKYHEAEFSKGATRPLPAEALPRRVRISDRGHLPRLPA
jgi:hypothetical protein